MARTPISRPSGSRTNGEWKSPQRFFNRELSWLEFNERVLEEADNSAHPLLERVRFLSISDSNLDEFYMVRVAGLKGQQEARVTTLSADGLSVSQQLQAINRRTRQLIDRQGQIWKTLSQALEAEHISIIRPDDLRPKEKTWLKQYFTHRLFAALTPLAVDPAHPFPLIANDGLCIVLQLKSDTPEEEDEIFWAVIPLPNNLPRLIPVMDIPQRFILLEDVLLLHLNQLLPGFSVRQSGLIHLIRDSEMDIDEDVEDLIEMFKSALRQRRRGHVIRLLASEDMAPELLAFVKDELAIEDEDVFLVEGLLNLADLEELLVAERPDLRFKTFSPKIPAWIKAFGGNYFDAIRTQDRLLHHPYHSFDAVVAFLQQAALDPHVLTIKQTLYRTSKSSPMIRALIEAAEAGKSVTAVVELKARFNEEDNIRLAEKLERAGVHVVFGFIDYKTHCKISLVAREEGNLLRTYAHFGTGNYHPITARIYTDFSLLTCDEALCQDAAKVFNFLTGYAMPQRLDRVIIAPRRMQTELLQRIEEEIQLAQKNGTGSIWAKMNALVDPTIIDALYRASQAGVKIDLVIRGICCLKPGVPGLSENIRVKSIVGRFLEHARVIAFGRGQPLPNETAQVFLSSADWMPRNFHSRVETLVPVTAAELHAYLLHTFQMNLEDQKQSWWLTPEGAYQRAPFKAGDLSVHEYFMRHPAFL
ncbi:MAG: RNA degradosome polyphosphate kinase [Candidatus Melainabacteria bacterium]|nr:RNA degradosome polyphosphate kinase [Candidatus Melainabacteria bacterium]